jgi:carbamoylphosphate synthase large subunit
MAFQSAEQTDYKTDIHSENSSADQTAYSMADQTDFSMADQTDYETDIHSENSSADQTVFPMAGQTDYEMVPHLACL